ncbi:uncharacterized protein LOC135348934 [Halichondria panicea]|uniref:uncharacterized protein LOC135348934 n=1 Tax=Halichondria panicea TaxID=6063 RepID=UPI00312B84B9
MQVQTVLISMQLFSLAAATLTSIPPVACPGDTVTFTCTLPGSLIRWTVTSPQLQVFTVTVDSNTNETQGDPAFRGVLTDSRGGMVTATLTSLSEASIVEGTMVECLGASSQEGPLTITVADPPSPPLNLRVSSILNQLSSSNITLDWDPPFSTGGVSVRYVLIISPTSLSGSPVTVETTSTQITVSYNTPYDVTVRAVNCAGMSQESQIVYLNFIFGCGSPVAPSRGSVDISGGTPPFSLGLQVIYRCHEGLFPSDVRTSTCTDVGGRGEWVENPGSLVCRERPVNCSLPSEPSNGTIVDYERLNETVLEGTVLTYQCDNGLSLTGPNTMITCTNAGDWSTEPAEAIMCVSLTEAPTVTAAATLSTGATLAISVTTTFVASTILGFLAGLLVMYLFTRKKAVYYTRKTALSVVQPTKPVGPVYEEVSPKEEIELNTNQAYGPLGL